MKLEIELVPSTVWYSSLYQLLPKEVWNKIRNSIILERGRKCQVCGETMGVMNLHEIWSYDDMNHIQKLEGFVLLCRMCHNVKHIGLSGMRAMKGELNFEDVSRHFCKVNGCSKAVFEKHKATAFEIWRLRSQHQWMQNFGEYAQYLRQ
ncbi:MAG: HNH endonuclease [Candidatus Bathyarchaeota archaeon]|nr:HNH endonuclease [Candidatus Bathyarchaeota archaeon]